MTIGLGLFYTNKSRVKQFSIAYTQDATAFIASEFDRIEKALEEYRTIVFKIIPIIIIVASLILIFIDKPMWRASAITAIAMLVVILLIDGTAHDRIEAYNKQLQLEYNKDGTSLNQKK